MNNNNQSIVKNPYQDLYIYNLQGKVNDEEESNLGKHFLGNWIEDDSSFLFFSEKPGRIVSDLLKRNPNLSLLDDFYFTYDQWQGGEISNVKIGKFIIKTPWEKTDTEGDEIRIVLDPGVVFGTGLHPTTRDCLRALIYLNGITEFQKVLDLGTGTGILAIASMYLGAEQVLAVDLNPLAAKTARKNVALNGFEKSIIVVHESAENVLNERYDLVIANIHFEVIKKLFKEEVSLDNKWFILSGLMRSQAFDLKEKIGEFKMEIIKEWDHEMIWYTFLMNNRKTV